MDLHERRQLLAPQPSHETDHEIVVRLERTVTFANDQDAAQVRIMYVPDRLVLPGESLQNYFDAVAKADLGSLENLAIEMLDDFNNEIVPRWVQIDIFLKGSQITTTDRQPGWDNPDLLSRINN